MKSSLITSDRASTVLRFEKSSVIDSTSSYLKPGGSFTSPRFTLSARLRKRFSGWSISPIFDASEVPCKIE